MTPRPFRILALSGGGARGIFQATYLAKLAETFRAPLQDRFDMIAGTSTGAIIGLALALGIDPQRVVNFYQRDASNVFSPRFAAELRSGPRYDQAVLRRILVDLFGTNRLADCRPPVLITGSSVDRFRYRLFSTLASPAESDGALLAVDVALASAAAPTFFAPVKPTKQERSYVDGGLWANSPALVAVLTAHQQRQIPFSAMRVLSVGNGEFEQGISPAEFTDFRPLSIRTTQALFELMFAAQETFADDYAMHLLPAGNFIPANAALKSPLAFDSSARALAELPALAEAAFERDRHSVVELFTIPSARQPKPATSTERQEEHVSRALIEAAGLSAFYPSRAYYSHRDGASSIDQYIATARQSLVMVSINLMTGVPFDGMLDVLERKLDARSTEFHATISLLSPVVSGLMHSLGPVLDLEPADLGRQISETIVKLLAFKKSLAGGAQSRLRLRLHHALPFGSAIMLDHRQPDGRIQIETKAYKTPIRKSFAFEVMRTGKDDDLYGTLQSAYEHLIDDGSDMEACPLDIIEH